MNDQIGYAPGMRDAANQLRQKADRAGLVVSRLDSQLAASTYSGPSADRFRAAMLFERTRMLKARDLISQAADILQRDANAIEAGGQQGAPS